MPCPYGPMTLPPSSPHEESPAPQQATDNPRPAKIRDYSINTKSFQGENGQVKKLIGIRLEWAKGADGRMTMKEIPNSEFEMDCDLCLLALGFIHPEHTGPIDQLALEKDLPGN